MPQPVAVILHFRNAAFSVNCLRSLAADGVGQAVVVDNSGDLGQSWKEVRAALEADARIVEHLLRVDPGSNLGFAAGTNLGIRRAREEFGPCRILLLNSDAEAEPGMTDALMRALDHAPRLAAAAPLLLDPQGEMTSPLRHYQACSSLQLQARVPFSMPYLSACALLLSEAIGGPPVAFDEDFFFYGEDVAFSADLQRAGGVLIVVEAARCRHEGAGSSRRYSLFYEYNMCRAHRLLARKLLGSSAWRYASWPLRELLMLARTLIHSVRSRSAEPLAGFAGLRPP